ALHRAAAAEGLASPARVRAERGALRLLRAAVRESAVAVAFFVHGTGGGALVADHGRRLCRARGEAGTRNAPDRAGLAAGACAQACAGHRTAAQWPSDPQFAPPKYRCLTAEGP